MEVPTSKRHRLPAEERKAAIVQAAVRLFSEKGFRGTTTRELAATVGVSEPVLYQHFTNKHDLYSAIIEEICQDREGNREELFAMARGSEDDEAFFGFIGNLILRWYHEEPQVIRLLLYSALENHELSNRFTESQVAFLYEILTEYMSRRMEQGAFRRMDPYMAARAFTGLISHQGMAATIFGLGSLDGTREETVGKLVDIFLNGMKTKETGEE
jgi:AcrR family transcriptional regulator